MAHHHGTHLRMPLVGKFPAESELGSNTKKLLSMAASVLSRVPTASLSTRAARMRLAMESGPCAALRPFEGVICDDLMLGQEGHLRPEIQRAHSDKEQQTCCSLGHQMAMSLHQRNEPIFRSSCISIARSCGEDVTDFRNVEVISGSLSDVPVLVYPHHRNIDTRLSSLARGFASSSATPLLRAVFAYVYFLNVHPLSNGNGRVARVMFNALLHAEGMNSHAYVPIRDFLDLSTGGYKVKMRRAVLFAEWDSIIEFMCACILLEAAAGGCAIANQAG